MEEVPKLTMTESLANGLKNRFFSEMLFDKKAVGFLKLSDKDNPSQKV
jgi:hypothetical protein